MNEYEKLVAPLQNALRMEAEGKEYYQQAARQSASPAGQKLFETLAADEIEHARRFQVIYDHVINQQNWPAGIAAGAGPKHAPGTFFAGRLAELKAGKEAIDTELQAVGKAMQMENESYELYSSLADEAGSSLERSFFEKIMAEEREHYLLLIDYREYLKDPSGWFVQKEHHSLDGA